MPIDYLTSQNQLLAVLPDEDYQRLHPYLERVPVTVGQVLYDPELPIDSVYFPLNSLISLFYPERDGVMSEVGVVGPEGMVGLSIVLGGEATVGRAIVQIAGEAVKLDGKILKQEFDRGGAIQKQLLLYTQLLMTQFAQNTVCTANHLLEQRFARWLASIQDRLRRNEFQLTQKYIAELLGTRRATITEAAGSLQRKGAIHYSRGLITILDRSILEASSCQCYAILRKEQDRLAAISQKRKVDLPSETNHKIDASEYEYKVDNTAQ